MPHIIQRVGVGAVFAFSIIATWAVAEPTQQQNSNAVWFENWHDLTNGKMVVVAPSGEMSEVLATSGTPVFQLSGPDVLDRIYRFKLRAQTTEEIPAVSQDNNNGRETSASDTVFGTFQTRGFFVVEDRVIL